MKGKLLKYKIRLLKIYYPAKYTALALLCISFVTCMAGLFYMYLISDTFVVGREEVQVIHPALSNNYYNNEKEMKETINTYFTQNLDDDIQLKIWHTNSLKTELELLKFVRSVTIHKILPNQIAIDYEIRKPLMSVLLKSKADPSTKKEWLVDIDGCPFIEKKEAVQAHYPRYLGIVLQKDKPEDLTALKELRDSLHLIYKIQKDKETKAFLSKIAGVQHTKNYYEIKGINGIKLNIISFKPQDVVDCLKKQIINNYDSFNTDQVIKY